MRLIGFLIFYNTFVLFAQQGPFHPAANQLGTNAIHRDSVIVASWADACTVVRGPQELGVAGSPLANAGEEWMTAGKADGRVVSLGDGGYATYALSTPLQDKPGYDFAVFENGFYTPIDQGYFLELAFVEVSSNGIDFFRFPAQSLTDTTTAVGTHGIVDPTMVHNLAGKYVAMYGTPFDLAELDSIAELNIYNITHIRIVDVVGSLNPDLGTRDAFGRLINDPFPTDFPQGGFDLDALAFLDISLGSEKQETQREVRITNPVANQLTVFSDDVKLLEVFDLHGKQVFSNSNVRSNQVMDVSHLKNGMYILHFEMRSGERIVQKIVKHT